MNSFINTAIYIFFSDFPVIMTILALVLAAIVSITRKNSQKSASGTFLSFLLFLAVGLSGLWGFVAHAFFPVQAAQFIGWSNSPFQFEVAVANLGMGVAGVFGVCATRGYRIATTLFTTCFLWGAAVGHVIQMRLTGNFAAGNAGTIFYNDIILPLLLIIFLFLNRKHK